MNKLDKLRENYIGFDKLSFNQRVNASKPIERWIRDTMNYHGVPFSINTWEPCDKKDDRQLKRDVQAIYNGNIVYAQLKFRQPDSGSDIGCALIQPYSSRAILQKIANQGEMASVFARDYKFDGITYVVLNNTWTKLILIPFQELIKYNYNKVLREWWTHPDKPEFGNSNRIFRSQEVPKAELRWKKDSGKYGFDSGIEKILCYLPISLFVGDSRVSMVDMIEAPDYLFGG